VINAAKRRSTQRCRGRCAAAATKAADRYGMFTTGDSETGTVTCDDARRRFQAEGDLSEDQEENLCFGPSLLYLLCFGPWASVLPVRPPEI